MKRPERKAAVEDPAAEAVRRMPPMSLPLARVWLLSESGVAPMLFEEAVCRGWIARGGASGLWAGVAFRADGRADAGACAASAPAAPALAGAVKSVGKRAPTPEAMAAACAKAKAALAGPVARPVDFGVQLELF